MCVREPRITQGWWEGKGQLTAAGAGHGGQAYVRMAHGGTSCHCWVVSTTTVSARPLTCQQPLWELQLATRNRPVVAWSPPAAILTPEEHHDPPADPHPRQRPRNSSAPPSTKSSAPPRPPAPAPSPSTAPSSPGDDSTSAITFASRPASTTASLSSPSSSPHAPWTAPYVWNAHAPAARKAGVS